MTAHDKKSSRFMLIFAWLVVGIPGVWGVEQTLRKSLDLFRAPAHAATAPSPERGAQTPSR